MKTTVEELRRNPKETIASLKLPALHRLATTPEMLLHRLLGTPTHGPCALFTAPFPPYDSTTILCDPFSRYTVSAMPGRTVVLCNKDKVALQKEDKSSSHLLPFPCMHQASHYRLRLFFILLTIWVLIVRPAA
jgi:hypothetical protein